MRKFPKLLACFKKLSGSEKTFRIRVGDYRIIADIDINSKLIKIRLIMHRKNIYKKY